MIKHGMVTNKPQWIGVFFAVFSELIVKIWNDKENCDLCLLLSREMGNIRQLMNIIHI